MVLVLFIFFITVNDGAAPNTFMTSFCGASFSMVLRAIELRLSKTLITVDDVVILIIQKGIIDQHVCMENLFLLLGSYYDLSVFQGTK